MQVTPSAADFHESCLAWASDSVLFGVSRAPNAESLGVCPFTSAKNINKGLDKVFRRYQAGMESPKPHLAAA
jgi:hypothetical protein